LQFLFQSFKFLFFSSCLASFHFSFKEWFIFYFFYLPSFFNELGVPQEPSPSPSSL
jgi:hypothetical protein